MKSFAVGALVIGPVVALPLVAFFVAGDVGLLAMMVGMVAVEAVIAFGIVAYVTGDVIRDAARDRR